MHASESPADPTLPDGAPSAAPRPADDVEVPSPARWRSAVPIGVGGVLAAALVALAVWSAPGSPLAEAAAEPDEQARLREAARARAEYAAMLRLAPAPLGRAPVVGALEPADAEGDEGRYIDYYAYDADSAAFAVLVTSAEFAPDLAVRRPDGQTVAASSLLRTRGRAEIEGLAGPGRYEVAVTSRAPGASGAYQVEILRGAAMDSLHIDGGARLVDLEAGPRRSGRHERSFAVAAGPEAPVVLRVASTAFAPRVHLLGPNGEVGPPWGTVERLTVGDSLHAVLVRYTPGWDAPYRLIVTSETAGARGPFALDARSVVARDVRTDSSRTSGRLGDESWLADGRYVDTYRFRTPGDAPVAIRVASDDLPPAVRLWRTGQTGRELVAEDLNAGGAGSVTVRRDVRAGEYHLEVLSGGEVEAGEPARGGDYTLAVRAERPDLPPSAPTPAADGGPAPGSKVFSTEVRRTGQSGGNAFEVGVTNVALSYPGGTRTRVQLSVSVRSVDYTGNWAPWESFAGKAYLVDDTGRRYSVSTAESQSPSGPTAEPGTVRRGTVVFYAPEVARWIKRVVLVASVGQETVTLPIPVP